MKISKYIGASASLGHPPRNAAGELSDAASLTLWAGAPVRAMTSRGGTVAYAPSKRSGICLVHDAPRAKGRIISAFC